MLLLNPWLCFTQKITPLREIKQAISQLWRQITPDFESWPPSGSRETHSYDFPFIASNPAVLNLWEPRVRVVKSHYTFLRLKKVYLNKLHFLFIWSESVFCGGGGVSQPGDFNLLLPGYFTSSRSKNKHYKFLSLSVVC